MGLLLAPTEILVTQHLGAVRHAMEAAGLGGIVRVERITGGLQGKARTSLLADVAGGKVDILIGTHALLSEDTLDAMDALRDRTKGGVAGGLGLAVIDEEQRFGVEQRSKLSERANLVFTTATPIPRSLHLVVQEAVGVSTLTEKLPAKRDVQTLLLGLTLTDKVIDRVQANVPHGSKVFWVCPTLEYEDGSAGSSARSRFECLQQIFPGETGLLHGGMSSADKEDVIARFQSGDLKILVATSLVEVGVDIPDVSICVIEKAESFGLSSLHQIRGRIGRGEAPPGEKLDNCFCVLLYDDEELGEVSVEGLSTDSDHHLDTRQRRQRRLQVLVDTTDGFEIAEEDMRIRGIGEVFGLRQHGSAQMKVCPCPRPRPRPRSRSFLIALHRRMKHSPPLTLPSRCCPSFPSGGVLLTSRPLITACDHGCPATTSAESRVRTCAALA